MERKEIKALGDVEAGELYERDEIYAASDLFFEDKDTILCCTEVVAVRFDWVGQKIRATTRYIDAD